MRALNVKRILVPTDLSESSIVALRYARMFAERFDARLTIFYSDPVLYPMFGLAAAGTLYVTDSPEVSAASENAIQVYAAETLAGMAYDIVTVAGQPVAEILREASGCSADLVVMATHGLRGWRRTVLGSVTEGVLHGTSCPVLSVSRPELPMPLPAPITNILCPINMTDVAARSLEYAAFLAEAFDARLSIVHVVEHGDPARAALDEQRVRRWMPAEVQGRTTYQDVVLRGGAAERVLDYAEDVHADLLVIGAQHKFFRDETVIGATTERLVRFSRAPVLTVARVAAAVSQDAAALPASFEE